MVDDEELLELENWTQSRRILSSYDFPGDDIQLYLGLALENDDY